MSNLFKYFILSVCFAFLSNSFAQDVRSQSGKLEGRWNGDSYRDHAGRLVYRMDNSGNVRDASGKLVMRFSNGTFRDASGRSIGRISDKGEVRSDNGRLMGRISDKGEVRNASGSLMGRVGSLSKEQAAVTFFFWDNIQ
ncbi:MAG: hypothetical protein JJT77_01205 [Crocinitomicaceae bacterium]|nr:hypothetical protein [Crocinitomicaceae bacterium]